MRGDLARDGAFARGGGPVDGDDHPRAAPPGSLPWRALIERDKATVETANGSARSKTSPGELGLKQSIDYAGVIPFFTQPRQFELLASGQSGPLVVARSSGRPNAHLIGRLASLGWRSRRSEPPVRAGDGSRLDRAVKRIRFKLS